MERGAPGGRRRVGDLAGDELLAGGRKPWAILALIEATVFYGVAAALGVAGPSSPEATNLVALVAIGAAAFLAFGPGLPRRIGGILIATALVASTLLVVIQSPLGKGAAVLAVPMAISLFARSWRPVATGVVLWLAVAAIWLIDSRSGLIGASSYFGEGRNPTALIVSGLPLAAAVSIGSLPASLDIRRFLWPLFSMVILAVLWVVREDTARFLLQGLGPFATHSHGEPAGSTRVFAILAAVIVGLNRGWACGQRRGSRAGYEVNATKPVVPVSRALRVRTLLSAGLVGIGLVALGSGVVLRFEPGERSVAVYDDYGGDWDRPDWDKLGVGTGGMFGLLTEYMRASDWSVEEFGREQLAETCAGSPSVLLLVNSPTIWAESERAIIRGYLESGGAVVALGDHTDVFGLQRGLNSLLGDYGIQFRFDSAYPQGEMWNTSAIWSRPVAGLIGDPSRLSWGIGASLDVRAPARASVVGRYAFSDEGLRENVQGAFLGNYQLDDGEEIGELPLIAVCEVGKGTVVAYGDTSSWQNGSLPKTWRAHVQPLLIALAADRSRLSPRVAVGLILTGVLACAVILVRRKPRSELALLSTCGVVLGALFLTGAQQWTSSRVRQMGEGMDWERVAVIDHSHAPDIGHYEAQWNAVGPLELSLMRSGLLPVHLDEWDREIVREAGLLAFVGSGVSLSSEEVRDVEAAVESGATVLCAVSGPRASPANGWLAEFGVRVTPETSGSLPAAEDQEPLVPRFVDAGALSFEDHVEFESVFNYGGSSLAAVIRRGRGRLIVIADTRFFSSRNTEGRWGWWPGNLRLIHDLLDSARTAMATSRG